MFKKVLIVVVLAIAGLFGYAALQPADYTVTRETVIAASPEVLFPYINSAQKCNEWMPWKDGDPTLQLTFSGPAEGVGSTASWDSPGQMGTGQSVVVESIVNQTVKTKISYMKPFEMTQMAEMSLLPAATGTLVRWSVTGQNNIIGRVMCIFMNMDKIVGDEFEKGLAKLKSIAEQSNPQ